MDQVKGLSAAMVGKNGDKAKEEKFLRDTFTEPKKWKVGRILNILCNRDLSISILKFALKLSLKNWYSKKFSLYGGVQPQPPG
jgi:hypothetical protein